MGRDVYLTSVTELLAVPEIYKNQSVLIYGWAFKNTFGSWIALSRDHGEAFDTGASIRVAPGAAPNPIPCAGHMVKLEGRFGKIRGLNRYGLVEVVRIWTPDGELIEDPPYAFTHDPVCSWKKSEVTAA